jgi:hypothetical protein
MLAALLAQLSQDWPHSPWLRSDWPLALRQQVGLDWLEGWLLDWVFQSEIDVQGRAAMDLSNAQNHGLNVQFTHHLHSANCSQGYWDDHWQIERVLGTDHRSVVRDGLHLEIQVQRHLLSAQQDCQPGDTVSVKMPRNRLEADRYVAIGNAGEPTGPQMAYFFHLKAEGAAILMQAVTTNFNQANIPFRLEVPYRLEHYPAKNAGMLQIADVAPADRFVQACHAQIQPYLQPGEPLFCEPMVPGVGRMPMVYDRRSTNGPEAIFPVYQQLAAAIFAVYTRPEGDTTAAGQLAQIIQQMIPGA